MKTQTSSEYSAPAIHRHSSSLAPIEGKNKQLHARGGAVRRSSSRAAASADREERRSRRAAWAATDTSAAAPDETQEREAAAAASAGVASDRVCAVAAASASATRLRRYATASPVAAMVSHVACAGFGLSFCSRARQVPNGTRPWGAATRIDSTAADSRSRAAPSEVAARPMLGGSRAALPRNAAWTRVAARAEETAFLVAREE